MDIRIVNLPKDKWKGTIIPIEYTTEQFYDVIVEHKNDKFTIEIDKKSFAEPVSHTAEEYDYPDKLYEDHWENAYAWGVLKEDKLIAAIETVPEGWSKRLRITELWVDDQYHKQGIGHRLIEMAKEQLRRDRHRAIILETQSCNVNAIEFYLHEGFALVGMDACNYTNNDIERKEVRLEFAWFPEPKTKLSLDQVEIRSEIEEDYYNVELMTQHAFWNKHHLGCDEHYLVHKLRQSDDYLPELSRIALVDGEVVGCIMYSKARVVDGDETHEVLTFGPLCIEPKWQGYGIGRMLLEETMKIAADYGHKGIVIFGEPDYYPLIGFKTCDNYGITTSDGKNFDPFMGIELYPDSFKDVKGKFYEADVFHDLPKDKVEDYSKKFPVLEKLRFPGQWD